MKIAEYKQISTEVIEQTILVDEYNENNDVIGQHEETITKEVPVMGMIYRDMTEKEKAEHNDLDPTIEPTQEDRIEAQVMFTALMTDTLLEEGDF